jgi:hypothetical protein
MPADDREALDGRHREDAAEIALAVARIQRELAHILERTASIDRRAGGDPRPG